MEKHAKFSESCRYTSNGCIRCQVEKAPAGITYRAAIIRVVVFAVVCATALYFILPVVVGILH